MMWRATSARPYRDDKLEVAIDAILRIVTNQGDEVPVGGGAAVGEYRGAARDVPRHENLRVRADTLAVAAQVEIESKV
jgi:hypothetical protein